MSNNCVTSGMNVDRPDAIKHTENSNDKDKPLFPDWNTTYQSSPERNQYENELPETVLRSDNGSSMRCISSPAASLTTTKRQPTTQQSQNHSSAESTAIGMGGTPPPLPLRPPAVPKRTRINGIITNNQQVSTAPFLKIQIPPQTSSTSTNQSIPTTHQHQQNRLPPTPLSPRKLQKGRNNNNTLTMVPPVIKSRQCAIVNPSQTSTSKTILPSLLNSSTLSTQTILFGNNTTDSGGGGGNKNTANNYLDNLAIQQLQDSSSSSNIVTTTGPTSTITTPPASVTTQIAKSTSNSKISIRQDSNVSSDSFSQTSSPSYTTKTMETPLIPPNNHHHHHHRQSKSSESSAQSSDHNKLNKLYNVTSTLRNNNNSSNQMNKQQQNSNTQACNNIGGGGVNLLKLDTNNCGNNKGAPDGSDMNGNGSSITKSVSTPASLQTIVRFHNGSNMSLHHRIIRDMRRPSGPYGSTVRVKFRFAQVLINAIALLAISGGLAAYFRAYPSSIQVITTNVSKHQSPSEQTSNAVSSSHNPAPGICLPVIVNFCLSHKVPYNFTVFPNYMGHFSQRDAQQELEVYDAVVDVRCYELAALFLCSVFVPKCGTNGQVVRPCRSLCFETKRRCGFFLDVFGLPLPDYLECGLFPESTDPEVCVGHKEVKEAKLRAMKPACTTGFKCDIKRCIPGNWQCDGHVDCKDQSDELNCKQCAKGMIHCGDQHCMAQEHMCDGIIDCPWGQDELNCLRLSDANGDEGHGQLEVFLPEQQQWVPACVTKWDPVHSANEVCSLLGYTSSNWTGNAQNSNTDFDISPPTRERESSTRKIFKSKTSLVKEFRSCAGNMHQSVNLTCTGFACGKIRKNYKHKATKRIVGGNESAPGDWPFLAALLGGPEEIFYCAGVLIADQWILTASHCVGNHSDVSGWTIQLGITRRHSHTYYAQKMKVRRVVPHPMYNLEVAHDNDVALFQLASKVTFHEHLLPVCLPPPNRELIPGTVCTVIGWGKKEDKGMIEYEPAVNEVQVPVLNREICNEWLENRDLNVTEGMICAGYPEGGKDACQGDSGGPLLCQDDNDPDRWFVGGIVSWGIKCAHPHLPGVYAYVPRYISWITQQMAYYSNSSIN